MLHTVHNPTFRCKDCGQTFKTRPRDLVVSAPFELPPCPACGGQLEVMGFLQALASSAGEGLEPTYDGSIADGIVQDAGDARRQWLKDFTDRIERRGG